MTLQRQNESEHLHVDVRYAGNTCQGTLGGQHVTTTPLLGVDTTTGMYPQDVKKDLKSTNMCQKTPQTCIKVQKVHQKCIKVFKTSLKVLNKYRIQGGVAHTPPSDPGTSTGECYNGVSPDI